MAMRYLIRRTDANDLDDIKSQVPDLTEQLGPPKQDLRRFITSKVNAMRSIVFLFQTRQNAEGWTWVCPTVEFIAENENGIFDLTDQFKVTTPTHLRHLKQTTTDSRPT